jgi:glycosyltransferase involved in cell wall biosynthesis
MRILVCTTQVPFARGGSEVLAEGLRDALRARGHETDLVALPFAWTPRENILRGALAWRLLDLSAVDGVPVDLVIATKFPSYAVQHPRKVVWLVHQHRQAYDWYGTPLSDWGARPGDADARKVLLRLDRRTLGEARGLFAISRNVAKRLRYANGLAAEALYPPTHLEPLLQPGPFEPFMLSVSRLDAAKRIDLLLRALALVPDGPRLIVVGRGPERQSLERLAGSLDLTSRVTFTGFLPDPEVAALYNRCRAVYYAPVDEDYGLSTIEAFHAGKPVLTTADAGGVLEFVEHGRSGLVARPEPEDLARCLAALTDEVTARRLGSDNRRRVAGITWDRVVSRLTDG